MNKVTSVDDFIARHPQWQAQLKQLRGLLQATELEETIKWGAPTYCIDGKNVVGIGAFKGYAGLWFFQGALLSDQAGVLVNAQEGKTQAMRQWRFGTDEEIDGALVGRYIHEAIDNQKAGRVVPASKAKPLEIPAELKTALQQDNEAVKQFQQLGLSKQREYAVYIADAKREQTKQSRLAKILPMILEGVGLNDKYKK